MCRGCGSEGLLREDEVASGRARCPQCGRVVDVEREAAEAREPALTDSQARLLPAG